MARARMLHKSISSSEQVNKLSLQARLLFTWTIAHADDEGRIKGSPEYIKAIVVPMTRWSFKRIRDYLEEIKNEGLIYYWNENNEWFIEFIKWNNFQSIRKDRQIPSTLPSFSEINDNHLTSKSLLTDSQLPTQYNIGESKRIEVNKSEDNAGQTIADKYTSNSKLINPRTFEPSSKEETAALEVWKRLESNNLLAFKSTYLGACKRGLPATIFYQFASEIEQDPTIKNPGAIFNQKVDDYLQRKA